MFSSLKGKHICGVYRTHDEKMRVVQAFFLHGLRNQEKCVYIADEQSKADVEAFLVACGIDLERGKKWGQFEILDSAETYWRKGSFDADDMLAALGDLEQRSLREGFRGFRVAGEMTWVLSDPVMEQQLISYEITVNAALAGKSCTGLCLYNLTKFREDLLVEVILAHPCVIIEGVFYENPCFNQEFRGTYRELVKAITKHV